ncbi:MAG TPA: CHAD domain-containing protein [Candidatus Obscuribacterales bacterium]
MKKPTEAEAKTLGDWGYLAIKKHFNKILKQEDDVLQDRDPEALHDMRVGMRRLRSAVTGFAPALLLPKAAKERKIAQVARILGALRDLDVLKESLENEYQPALPKSEQKSLNTVLDHLAKQRKHELKRVQSTLEDRDYQKLKQSLKKWLKEPEYKELGEFPIRDVLPDLLMPSVSQLFLHPAWLVGAEGEAGKIEVLRDLNQNTVRQLLAEKGLILHSLRKQTKRSRYQMELFTDFYGSNYAAYVGDLDAIQKILGKIQDSFVLAEFLTDALDSDTDSELPTLNEQLAQTSYQAWQDWQPLQAKYLNPSTRQALHLELLGPISDKS